MQKSIIENIIKNYETPIYVFDIDKLKQRIKFLKENLTKRLELCYAIKANTFIVGEINDDVERFEVCSPGEYSICEESKITPEKIVISGVYKTPSVIEYMITTNPKIGRYTVESLEQLKLLDELSKKHKAKINVLLRLTSGNQFGINGEEIEEIIAKKELYTNLNFVGIQYFSGTQKRTNKRLQKEIDYLDEFLTRLEEKYKFKAEELEFGTGFPVHYFQGEEFDEIEFLKEFSNGIDNMKYSGKIVIELGRSISATCGYYLTKVVDKKTNKGQNYAILDGGIHHLVYYGQTMAMKFPHLEIYPLRDTNKIKKDNNKAERDINNIEQDNNTEQDNNIVQSNKNTQDWNIMGSLCTINDIIIKQYPVSNLQIGDVFIFKNTGAYCMTEGISLFLSRELPEVALVKGGEMYLVREAFKTYTLNKPNYM